MALPACRILEQKEVLGNTYFNSLTGSVIVIMYRYCRRTKWVIAIKSIVILTHYGIFY